MDHALFRADLPATMRKQVDSVAPGLLSRFPLDGYIEALDALDEYEGYAALPARVEGWCAEITSRHGAAVLEDYHRLLLLALIERFEARAAGRAYPESILTLFRNYLRGVVARMPRNPPGFYLHEDDRFVKDLAVCRQKLVPCGAQLVDRRSGVPRSSAWSGGLGQLLRFPLYFARRIGTGAGRPGSERRLHPERGPRCGGNLLRPHRPLLTSC
jgi:hypothetical protein